MHSHQKLLRTELFIYFVAVHNFLVYQSHFAETETQLLFWGQAKSVMRSTHWAIMIMIKEYVFKGYQKGHKLFKTNIQWLHLWQIDHLLQYCKKVGIT